MMIQKRRSVAPVIATLLMVAIAVVGGMLVFVFAQDFFTATDSMTGPTIEILQIFGYDARDLATGASGIENDEGVVCTVGGAIGGDLEDQDAIALYVRNLGSNDVIISDVSVYNNKQTINASGTLTATFPLAGSFVVIATAACAAGPAGSSTIIGAGQDATIIVAIGIGPDGFDAAEEKIKLGRPIFVKIETSSGNIFAKQIVNGRQVG